MPAETVTAPSAEKVDLSAAVQGTLARPELVQGLLSRLDFNKVVPLLIEWFSSQEEFQGNVRDALKAIYRQNQRLEEEIRALRRP